MNHTVSPLIEKSGAFQDVLNCIRGGQLPCSVFGVTPHAKAYFADAVARAAQKQVLCITSTEQAARENAAAAGVLFPDNELTLRNAEAKGREEELVRVGVMKNAAHTKEPVFFVDQCVFRTGSAPAAF